MYRGIFVLTALVASTSVAGPAPARKRRPARVQVATVKLQVAPSVSIAAPTSSPAPEVVSTEVAEVALHDSTPPRSDGTIAVKVPHHFARADARTRVGYLLEFWREAYGTTATWTGDEVVLKGAVFGMVIDATFRVTDDSVEAEARDPGWFWRGKALGYVERLLRKYMHPEYLEVD